MKSIKELNLNLTKMTHLNSDNTLIFLQEIQKRIVIPEGQFEKFLELWEFKKFNRNEIIMEWNRIKFQNFPFLY